MTDWARFRYAVVDVEGNGQQPPDLVELAVIPIVGGSIGEPAGWLVRPKRPITPFATHIHGLTNHDVDAAPHLADIADEVRYRLDCDILVAHNAHVDVAVLQRELNVWDCPETLDTLRLARRLLPDQASYKLGSLVQALSLADGLPTDLAPHRATYDALVTARLFVRLATRTDGSPLPLAQLRNERPSGHGNDAPTLF